MPKEKNLFSRLELAYFREINNYSKDLRNSMPVLVSIFYPTCRKTQDICVIYIKDSDLAYS